MNDKTATARVILDQIGGREFLMMTGAKNLVADGNTLRMTLPRNNSQANRLWITLNEADDLYTMRFFRQTGGTFDAKKLELRPIKTKEIYKVDSVFWDQMADIFTRITGMDTRLPRIVGINA